MTKTQKIWGSISTALIVGIGVLGYLMFSEKTETMTFEEIQSRVSEWSQIELPKDYEIIENRREIGAPIVIHGTWITEEVTLRYPKESYASLRERILTEYQYRLDKVGTSGYKNRLDTFQFSINDEKNTFSYRYTD